MDMKKSGHPRFYELIETIADLHHRKNSNYARKGEPLSNFKECESFGIPAFQGCLVRMSDKWSRIKELASGKPDAVGESIKDTLQDLAVYSLIATILYEEQEKHGHRRTDTATPGIYTTECTSEETGGDYIIPSRDSAAAD